MWIGLLIGSFLVVCVCWYVGRLVFCVFYIVFG